MHVPSYIMIPMPRSPSSAAQHPLSIRFEIKEEDKEGFALVGRRWGEEEDTTGGAGTGPSQTLTWVPQGPLD